MGRLKKFGYKNTWSTWIHHNLSTQPLLQTIYIYFVLCSITWLKNCFAASRVLKFVFIIVLLDKNILFLSQYALTKAA